MYIVHTSHTTVLASCFKMKLFLVLLLICSTVVARTKGMLLNKCDLKLRCLLLTQKWAIVIVVKKRNC